VDRTRPISLALLAAGFSLALGTPGYLAYTDPGIRNYLLHPILFVVQAAPFALAAVLWYSRWLNLPPAGTVLLAALLFFSAALLYVPILAGLVPMGGDMVAVAFMATGLGTAIGVLTVTFSVAGAVSLWRRRRTSS